MKYNIDRRCIDGILDVEKWNIRLNRNYIDVPIDKLIYILQFKLKHVFHCESMIAYHITRKKICLYKRKTTFDIQKHKLKLTKVFRNVQKCFKS